MQFLKKFSRHLLKISFVLALLAPSFVFVAEPAFAVDATCSCYCGDTKNGAVKQSTPQPSMVECTALCKGLNLTPITCSVGNATLPENDGKCWTEDECAKYAMDRNNTPTPGIWGGQSEKCVETKSGLATGYCYSPSIGVNLNIPVLGHTTVKGFDEYLALAYKFLLPAMSLIAVVMVMVGGLEYVIAGGSSKRIDKAKTRISNALIGLVLLMSAYAIASLLDPRLVNLNALKMPLIKKAVLLDPGSSCEQLSDYKFDIDPPKGTCGATKGKIIGIENVVSEAKNSNFKLGDPCDFMTCDGENAGKACMKGAGGTTNRCIACADLSSSDIPLSEATCNLAAKNADAGDRDKNHYYYCEFEDQAIDSCMSAGMSSAEPYVNCSAASPSTDDPCSAYDKIMITHKEYPSSFEGLWSYAWGGDRAIDSISTIEMPIAIKVCVSDPCGFAKEKGKTCALAYNNGSYVTRLFAATYGQIIGYESIDTNCVTN